MSNPFEQVHINAQRDTERKREALKQRNNKVLSVNFGNARDGGYAKSYPIEDEVQSRATCANFRTHLTASEAMIAKAERDTLSHVSTKGFPNRSTYEKVERYYYLLQGEWVESLSDRETITVQDHDYIASQIQLRVASYGVSSMSKYDIYEILNTVSRVYLACDMLDIEKPAVYANNKSKAA